VLCKKKKKKSSVCQYRFHFTLRSLWTHARYLGIPSAWSARAYKSISHGTTANLGVTRQGRQARPSIDGMTWHKKKKQKKKHEHRREKKKKKT
jgi:hypothetical protein